MHHITLAYKIILLYLIIQVTCRITFNRDLNNECLKSNEIYFILVSFFSFFCGQKRNTGKSYMTVLSICCHSIRY